MPVLILSKNKRPSNLVNFAAPIDQRVNLNESNKLDKYQGIARETIAVPQIPVKDNQ